MANRIKDAYRQEILRLSPYVKINAICKQIGISQSAMSYFLNHKRDELLSIDKLQQSFVDLHIRN